MMRSRTFRLAALVGVATLAALAIVALASARSGATSTATKTPKFTKAQITAGKKVFLTAGCKTCHTLKAANSHGTVGPNLDQLKPGYTTIIKTVTHGFNGPGTAMPAFGGYLSKTKINDVAAFVYTSTRAKK